MVWTLFPAIGEAKRVQQKNSNKRSENHIQPRALKSIKSSAE